MEWWFSQKKIYIRGIIPEFCVANYRLDGEHSYQTHTMFEDKLLEMLVFAGGEINEGHGNGWKAQSIVYWNGKNYEVLVTREQLKDE